MADKHTKAEANRLKYPELYKALLMWREIFGPGVQVVKLPEGECLTS